MHTLTKAECMELQSRYGMLFIRETETVKGQGLFLWAPYMVPELEAAFARQESMGFECLFEDVHMNVERRPSGAVLYYVYCPAAWFARRGWAE